MTHPFSVSFFSQAMAMVCSQVMALVGLLWVFEFYLFICVLWLEVVVGSDAVGWFAMGFLEFLDLGFVAMSLARVYG